jgi:hypothetical protein
MKIVCYLPEVDEIILVHLDRETIEFGDFIARIDCLTGYSDVDSILETASKNVLGYL